MPRYGLYSLLETTYQFLDNINKYVNIPATGRFWAAAAGWLRTIFGVTPSSTTTHQQTLHNHISIITQLQL